MSRAISLSSFYGYKYVFNCFTDDEIRHRILYLHVASSHAKQSKKNFYRIRVECKVTSHTCLCRCTQLILCVRIIGNDELKYWYEGKNFLTAPFRRTTLAQLVFKYFVRYLPFFPSIVTESAVTKTFEI